MDAQLTELVEASLEARQHDHLTQLAIRIDARGPADMAICLTSIGKCAAARLRRQLAPTGEQLRASPTRI